MIWKPNVTVASVLERDGRFLLVEEETEYGIRFNQPAGHLDRGESLLDAAVRETLEETAYTMRPDSLVGIYLYPTGAGDLAYLRFAFAGEIVDHDPARQLDAGILAAHWLTVDEIRARQAQHRSPMVLRCIDDWLAGRRYPLQLLNHFPCAG
ncbi:MAG: Phosphatase NudJ [Accumulibacter sp.]|uniref:NUDIX hydrolase n=1 Tax=Accumulibacter sp. TaxID=2053492 RepID=UPI00121723DA|nr:NUDIX hydrolase [Accumulibacter sp.]QKS29321.1 MAG: NUDIX hydrolase [Candidatus Accumulibacter similis]TLD45680.1 MAG: Phosphatase NudJ [Accumulibacter sp.]